MFTTDLYDYVSKGMYLAYERTPAGQRVAVDRRSGTTTRARCSMTARRSANSPRRRFASSCASSSTGETDLADPTRVRLMTNLGTVSGYKRAEVLVRDEDDWPLPSTKWRRLYLGARSLSLTRRRCRADELHADGHDQRAQGRAAHAAGDLRGGRAGLRQRGPARRDAEGEPRRPALGRGDRAHLHDATAGRGHGDQRPGRPAREGDLERAQLRLAGAAHRRAPRRALGLDHRRSAPREPEACGRARSP